MDTHIHAGTGTEKTYERMPDRSAAGGSSTRGESCSRKLRRQFLGWCLVPLALSAAGCTTGYWVDRGRDALDIVTANVGLGLGAKAQVGVFHAGLFGGNYPMGLEHGQFYYASGEKDPQGGDLDLFFLGAGGQGVGHERHKSYNVLYLPLLALTMGKSDVPWSYCTKFEIAVGLGPAVRLGVNPGELLDFLLGWFGVDMYGDDIACLAKETAPAPAAASRSQEKAPGEPTGVNPSPPPPAAPTTNASP